MTSAFEKYLFIKKGLGPVTVSNHSKAIKRIAAELGGAFSRRRAENYVLKLYQSTASYSHKSNQAKSLEYWFEFRRQPIHFARQRKPKPMIKQTLSESEVTRMLFSCRNIREKAIIGTLAYAGLRPKELEKLHVQDVDFSSNTLRVINGKGAKDGIIYLPAAGVQILMQYLSAHPRRPEQLMFVTIYDKPFTGYCQRKLMKTIGRRARIDRRVYPYLLRHSLGTNLVLRGGDIFLVKRQLRHSNIATSLGYIHCLGVGMKNEYERYAPNYS